MYSLHNSDFGGVYYYIWEEAPQLYKPFHKLVESQGLPLHLGEPEMPYEMKFASAIYKDSSIAAEYDFLEQQIATDPAEVISGGTLSFEYARTFCDPFTLICEMPYFYHPAIDDTSESDIVRRDALLKAIQETKENVSYMKELYDAVKGELTVHSPFRDAIEETFRVSLVELTAEENWVRADPKTAEMATVAEKFDSLVIHRFYRLLGLGMFVRMVEAQIAATGVSPSLSSTRDATVATFKEHAADLEAELDYTVVPIQKLVRVQLGSALLTADYAARRQAQR